MSVTSSVCILAVLFATGLFFCALFSIMLFSEFEQNTMDQEDVCATLNQLALGEHIAPIFLAASFLLSFQGLAFVVTAPMAVYNIKKIRDKTYLLAVTELKFRRVPAWRWKEGWSKLGFYLLAFFFYLHCMISAFLDASNY
ncbi:cornichon [Mycena alexandri]|uniref:Cornichon n=1 Tax=Mycena alexandri TaxID=1745969 RepID=A0AAD6SBG1_9AGAR|nr:cornichon [Mycena alexandri]